MANAKPWSQGKAGKGRGGRPWQRKRKRIFGRDKYLCQECKRQGILTAVELHGARVGFCDHITPKAEGGTDDDTNLQTLCCECHDLKTSIEGARAKGVTVREYSTKVGNNGWPLDGKHPANSTREGG